MKRKAISNLVKLMNKLTYARLQDPFKIG
ncbi:hypothetical protein HOE425_331940 [Hoeflea sp. EC-HK425]|nr:hypothetical protein HOE425_331940 [Hoeflea sp. EC-HK425]